MSDFGCGTSSFRKKGNRQFLSNFQGWDLKKFTQLKGWYMSQGTSNKGCTVTIKNVGTVECQTNEGGLDKRVGLEISRISNKRAVVINGGIANRKIMYLL